MLFFMIVQIERFLSDSVSVEQNTYINTRLQSCNGTNLMQQNSFYVVHRPSNPTNRPVPQLHKDGVLKEGSVYSTQVHPG